MSNSFQGSITGEGYVYIMSYPNSDKVKIGHALNPNARAKDIGGTLAPEQPVSVHLALMAEIVIDELAGNGGSMTRIDLCNALGLKIQSYPQEAQTQAETTWLCSILIRMLQDAGRVRYEEVSANRVVYHLTGETA